MPMNETQKAKNKSANSVKRRAHSQRCRLLCAAIAAAESAPDVVQAKQEADAASAESELAWKMRAEGINYLRQQIAKIERQILDAENEITAFQCRDEEKEAFGRWQAMKDKRVAAAEADFPDLAGGARWSAASWQPPKDTLDAMNAAIADVGNI